jgi:hypothetical protein
MAKLLELRVWDPKTNMLIRAFICPFLDLYTTSHPTGGVRFLQKAWNPLSDDAQVIFRTAEFNLDALNIADLGPTRPFSVVNARCGHG